MEEKGITLIEILVVLFIIAMLLMILVSDFPKIQKQFALSRATYKFAQDLRRAQDMALSGQEIKKQGGAMLNAQGYGVYLNLSAAAKKYMLYADLNGDKSYNVGETGNIDCDSYDAGQNTGDCVIETIDLGNNARGVFIKEINNTNNDQYVSINFNPPNPTISISPDLATINGINGKKADRAGIVFGLDSDPINSTNTRTVWIWASGLIEAR